jgi:hypothetical protein
MHAVCHRMCVVFLNTRAQSLEERKRLSSYSFNLSWTGTLLVCAA